MNAGMRSVFVETVTSKLKPGTAAVVAELDEGWMAPLDTRMEALGGEVIRQWRSDFEDEQLDKEVKEEQAELAALKDELKQANANSKNAYEAARRSARQLRPPASAWKPVSISWNRRSGRSQELKSQLSRSQAEAKAGIEKGLAAMQVEHKRRTALLKQAWSLTKDALAA